MPRAQAAPPRPDILDPEYLRMTLDAYRTGQRASGFMAHAITQIGPSQDERLAAIAKLPASWRRTERRMCPPACPAPAGATETH